MSITSGQVPLPSWAKPSAGGDHALAIFDRGTGILRGYFGVARLSATKLTYANASYLYTNGSNVTADNYWLGYVQGSSSVVGIANELTQIGAEEVTRGEINHMVSATFPSAKAGLISFPAKASDGKLADADAPAEGQVFTFPANLDIDTLNLSPLSAMIAKAVQTHGGIVSDQNFWTMAFNLESPFGMGDAAPNPWAAGGAASNALGGNLTVNDFPWALTEWLPVGYAGTGGTTPTPTPTVTPTPTRPRPSPRPSPHRTPTPTPTVTPTPTDTTAPTATVAPPAPVTMGESIALSWSATDLGGSGVKGYDVRYRSASASSALGAHVMPPALQGTTLTSTTVAADRGHQYCFSARATDVAGNVGG